MSRHIRTHAQGQALVEFTLVLFPLLLLIMAIIQFGVAFGAQAALEQAARAGARAGVVEPYNRSISKAANDAARNDAALAAAKAGMPPLLSINAPQFTSGTFSGSGDAWSAGDANIVYARKPGSSASDTRAGELMTVALTYHLPIFVPFMDGILPHDASGNLILTMATTMEIER